MKKKKFIISFIIPIVIVIALLAIQAFCDLELPTYTSSIINDGIASKGISSNLPEVMSEDIYNAILRLTDENGGVLTAYTYIIKDNLSKDDYNKYSKLYPILKKENIYILKDLKENEKEKIEKLIEKPLIIAWMLKANNESLVKSLNITVDSDNNALEWLMNLDDNNFKIISDSLLKGVDNFDDTVLKEFGGLCISEMYSSIGVNMNDYQMNFIINKGIQMLFIALIGMIIAIIVSFLVGKIASKVSFLLRSLLVNKILAFSAAEFKEFGASSLITRSTNDVEQIKMFSIMFLRIVVFAPIMGIGAFIKVYDNPLNWLIAVAIIAILVLIGLLFGFALPKFKKMQKLIDKVNLVSREIITGMPVIRTFHTERYEEKRFDKANTDLTKTNLFVNRLMGVMMPSMMLVMNIISILIIWFGAKSIDIGNLEIGTLIAFISYTMQIIMAFLMISLVSVMMPRAIISLKRIKEILKKEITIKENAITEDFCDDKKGIVEFKNVTFKYPDADEAMLKDISFKAMPGTVTAIIGSTGSGKSTLINLIPRFFDTTEGAIYVDGVDIKKASIKELRERIGYVPQKGILFSGTIESNIKFGCEELNDKDMEKAAEVSQALDFIKEKENGFQSAISQGGSNVSGGQKQRLSIARAIAKKPEIYIFDDSFSALDFKTDAKLRKALKTYAKDATILIVAQRISTIMNADDIIVLNEGRIVGRGTHKELVKTCKIYKEIALSQIKEEEL